MDELRRQLYGGNFAALQQVDEERLQLQLRVNKVISDLKTLSLERATTHYEGCWQRHMMCLADHITAILEGEPDD